MKTEIEILEALFDCMERAKLPPEQLLAVNWRREGMEPLEIYHKLIKNGS